MIDIEDILILHHLSINDFGGSHGIRDEALLHSAISRPYQTFDGADLYKSPIEKAAAVCESLVKNHPFVDGNKRIGALAMIALLKNEHIELIALPEALYELIIDISTGKLTHDQIVLWLEKNVNR